MSASIVNSVRSRIAKLKAELSDHEQQARFLGRVIAELEGILADAEQQTFEPLVDVAAHSNGRFGVGFVRVGATDAILSVLAEESHLRGAEIVQRAVQIVDTKSDKPERLLFNTLHALKKAGRVTDAGDGRLTLQAGD